VRLDLPAELFAVGGNGRLEPIVAEIDFPAAVMADEMVMVLVKGIRQLDQPVPYDVGDPQLDKQVKRTVDGCGVNLVGQSSYQLRLGAGSEPVERQIHGIARGRDTAVVQRQVGVESLSHNE
jgi:hypothetical protein